MTQIDPRTLSNDERSHGASPAASARDRLLRPLPVHERRLELAGITTPVLEGGAGFPIVLLHGPLGNAAHFLRIIPELVKTHRVVVPDLPGHGASQVHDGPLDAERVLRWLGALIAETCAEPPVLVGQLLGGAIAARFAAAHGARVRSLVLADTFGLQPLQPAPEFGAALGAFLSQPSAATHDALWQHCARDLGALRAAMGESWEPFAAYNLERAQTPAVQAALASLMEQFGAEALAESELARIAVPTALLWGRHDMATPLRVAEAASARHGWPLHVIEGANDDPPVEQPGAFVRALRAAVTAAGAP